MQHYLRLSEAKLALDRGTQVEQFLGGFSAGGDPAIRYATIRKEKNKVVTRVYEVYEPFQPGYHTVAQFSPIKEGVEPDDFHFDTLEETVTFLEYRNGASWGKFVMQGGVDEEYRVYKTPSLKNPQA